MLTIRRSRNRFISNMEIPIPVKGPVISELLHKLEHSIIPIISGPLFTKKTRLTGIGIHIINLRRSDDRLRFIMGTPILIRRRLLSE